MKTFAVLMVLSLALAIVTCQAQTQTQTPQTRQSMSPWMSMMLMRTLDNFLPLMFMMNQGGMGSMMGGGLFPLLAFNTIF